MNFRSLKKKFLARHLILVCLVVFFSACVSTNKIKPENVIVENPLIAIKLIWKNSVGKIDFPLKVALVGEVAFLANSSGEVIALDSTTGENIWRTNLAEPLSAGVGADGRYVAVVNKENQLIVLDYGKPLWREKLNAVTITPPLVAGGRVFTVSSDYSINAFDVRDGSLIWSQKKTSESLVLGQAGLFFASSDRLMVGVGGRLLAMNPNTGGTVWDSALASSRGTNEVERLVDLLSGYSKSANQVCMRSYLTNISCVDVLQGKILWSKNAQGAVGLTGDNETLIGVEDNGQLIAFNRSNGDKLWFSDRLRNRVLSPPLLIGRSIVVGDDLGNLFFLSKNDATLLNKINLSGEKISFAPIVAGKTLLVVTGSGSVFGYYPQ